MEKYSLDTVCTGNYKADGINSLIMEEAADYAEHRAQKDWEADERPENFWVDTDDGQKMNAEAQEIFNEYYDKKVEQLYKFVNKVIEIDSPTEKELKAERLSHYICDDEERYESMEKALELLEKQAEIDGSVDANEVVLVWEHLDGTTVDGILELI